MVPITAWNEKKSLIKTNVEIEPTETNGLIKRSVADCLQTRPIYHKYRLVKIRGRISSELLEEIDEALSMVFGIRFR